MVGTPQQRVTSWDDIGWAELPNGSRACKFVVGDEEDEQAPVVFQVEFPPNCVVAPHTHATDYCEIILAGEQTVGKTVHRPGDIRIVKAGTGYGPLVAGPAGCRVLVVFADARWPAIPKQVGKDQGLHVDVLTSKFTAAPVS